MVRDGISHDLDLAQGIDFAIYLGGMFERNTAVTLRKMTEQVGIRLAIEEQAVID